MYLLSLSLISLLLFSHLDLTITFCRIHEDSSGYIGTSFRNTLSLLFIFVDCVVVGNQNIIPPVLNTTFTATSNTKYNNCETKMKASIYII